MTASATARAANAAVRKSQNLRQACRAGVVVLTAALALAGCSINRKSASLQPESNLVTASVAKPIRSEGVDGTDVEVIKNAVAGVDKVKDDSNLLAWSNPETGSRGTITAIDHFIGSHGQKCKKFETTVDSFMGISLYDGETCELRPGFWVLSWFLRKEK